MEFSGVAAGLVDDRQILKIFYQVKMVADGGIAYATRIGPSIQQCRRPDLPEQ